MLVDTHAHLNWNSYQEDYDQVLQRAKDAGVGIIINIGTDFETSQQVLKLHPGDSEIRFYSTIGFHPHESDNSLSDESIHKYIGQLNHLYTQFQPQIVGIGECGLDFHTPPDSPGLSPNQKENQQKLFLAQIDLAKKLQLPLVIHCRDAWDQIWDFPLDQTSGVFHNFSGSEEDVQKALDLGYYLSFSCVITYPKNEHLRTLIKTLPLDKIVSETDCPFLPPQTIRGQRNEPAHVLQVIETIAQIKNIPIDEVSKQLEQNTYSLFSGIKP